MIYERRHTRLISDFGGLAHVMPIFAAIFLIVTLASIGLPGTNGFVGEFLILLGTFKTNVTYAVIGTSGIVLAAVYMLWMVQRVFYGTVDNEDNRKLTDIDLREKLLAIPLVIMIFWIGIYPQTFLSKIEPSVQHLIRTVAPENMNTEAKPTDDYGRPTQKSEKSKKGEFEWVTTGE
jgi:NADH-quinone oxidoreductase subunit M